MKPSTVREAKLSDCQTLANLMQESAQEQQVTEGGWTCKDLEKKVFGHNPVVKIIVNEQRNNVIIGYLAFSCRYSSTSGLVPFLTDIYVVPEHRRRGVATALWKAMHQMASAVECRSSEVVTKAPNDFVLSLGAYDATDLGCREQIFQIEKEAIKEFIKRKDTPSEFIVREATERDIPDINEGVRSLHSHLGRLHEVVCNEAELLEYGFGKKPSLKSFVAEQNGAIVGYTIFSYIYGLDGTNVFMEDLYVSPECRGAGIGVALWLAILKEALQRGCKRCIHTVDADNKPSKAFYKSQGAIDATETKDFHLFKIPLSISYE